MVIDAFRDQDTFFSDTTKEKLDQMSTVEGHTKGLKEANLAKIWRKSPISSIGGGYLVGLIHRQSHDDILMATRGPKKSLLLWIANI